MVHDDFYFALHSLYLNSQFSLNGYLTKNTAHKNVMGCDLLDYLNSILLIMTKWKIYILSHFKSQDY